MKPWLVMYYGASIPLLKTMGLEEGFPSQLLNLELTRSSIAAKAGIYIPSFNYIY